MQDKKSQARDITYKAIKMLQLKTKRHENDWSDNVPFSCPFHEDKTPSLYIHLLKGVVHCFGCGFSGSIFKLYHSVTGNSLSHDLDINIDEFSLFNVPSKDMNQTDEEKYKMREGIFIKVIGEQKNVRSSPLVVDYFRKRGILFSVAEQMKMKFLPKGIVNEFLFYNRLLIPIYENGKMISIEGRDVTRKQKKKVLYPKNSSVNTLYDIDYLNKNETLYVVEGLMDLAVLRSDSFFKNSTTIFGASITDRQIWLLSQFKDVVIIPNSDEAGLKSLIKLKERLKTFRILEVPLNLKDVGEIPEKTQYTVQYFRERGWIEKNIKSSDEYLIFKGVKIH
jgi:DNA primase